MARVDIGIHRRITILRLAIMDIALVARDITTVTDVEVELVEKNWVDWIDLDYRIWSRGQQYEGMYPSDAGYARELGLTAGR